MSIIGHHGVMLSGAGGPSAWTPADLGATLAFWANDTSALTQSGGTASQWDDVRGNGRYFSQATTPADRPTVNASGLNGMRTLEFQSSDYMDADAGLLAAFNAVGFIAAFIVYKNRSSSSAARYALSVANNSISGVRFSLQTSRSGATDKTCLGVRRQDGDSFATLNATTGVGTSWCIGGVRMHYTNGDGFVDVNGVLGDGTDLALTTSGNTSATNAARVRLGAHPNNPANSFADADIAEIIILAGASMPADADFDKLNGYLAHRWGLAALLDVSHPYKAAPP